MQNLLRSFSLILLFSTLSVGFEQIFAQCSPPPSETCEEAYVFCSPNEMNGYSCNTPSTTLATCREDCSAGGPYSYRNWLAFVSQGGNVSITLHVGTCTYNNGYTGLGWGIWGDCNCKDEIKCTGGWWQQGTTNTYQVNLKPCKVYYITLDPYPNVICDFTINTSGGPPTLSPLGFINNQPSGIIGPVCEGACNYELFVDSQPGGCEPKYIWTLDGNEVGGNGSKIKLNFPVDGDFIICVTAYIGNPQTGAICAEEGPKCATVQVRPSYIPDKIGVPRTLCWEDAHPNGYLWHSLLIFNSGTYKQQFSDANCCPYDSVVNFTILDVPVLPGPSRTLCWEDAHPNGYKWNTQLIYTSGIYKERFTNVHCWVDSLVEFIILDVPELTGPSRTFCWDEANPNGYKWNTQLIYTSGIYKERFKNVHCWVDSVVEFIILDVPAVLGKARTYCWEKANPNGYKWNTQLINTSGTYKERFKNGPCSVDSVVDFNILPEPIPPDVYYITCDNTPFIDVLKQSFSPCTNHLAISLPNTTDPFKCDSSYRLTAINVDYAPRWKVQCFAGMVEISPNISLLTPCNAGETYQFNYRWYKKNDSDKKTIGNDERLVVDAVNEEYCLEVKVRVDLETVNSICTNTFCENINEGDLAPICFPLAGDQILCSGKNGSYWIDTILNQKVSFYTWNIKGGTIISKPDSSRIDVKWNLVNGDTGQICVFYNTDCGESCKKCLNVLIGESSNPYAGPNDTICDLVYKFKGQKDKGGYWSQISGPGQSTIDDTTDPTSDVKVDKAGIYRFVYSEKIGACNNIDTVDLYFNAKPDSTGPKTVLQYCDSATINGYTYFQTTQFIQQLKTASGCDSTIFTELLIFESHSIDLSLSACDSLKVNNRIYTATGIYKQIQTDANGCDSLLNLKIQIGKTSDSNLNLIECDSAIINNQVYKSSGAYTQTQMNASGCDSIIHIDLVINSGSKQTFSFDACDSVMFNGKAYTKSGDYLQRYQAVNGCDSIIVAHVNITKSNTSPLIFTYCDSANINGTTYSKSGSYTQFLKSTNGCDSTLNIDLTIVKSNSSNFKLTSCDSALINNQLYLQSGNYTQLLQNSNQCDSILNIDLSIVRSSNSNQSFRSCDSINVNNQTYNQTGIYKQVLANSNLCDSILIIDYIRLSVSTSNLNFKSCDSILVNGQIYKQSGNYTQTFVNANQCDSILNLNIVITKNNSFNYNLSSCDSAIINGQVYKQTGVYKQTLQNAVQCDSVLIIDLSIFPSIEMNYLIKGCDSAILNKRVYTFTGDYKQILTTANGCDSTLDLHVDIAQTNQSQLALMHCDSIIVNKQVYTLTGVYKQLLTNVNGCDSTLTLDLVIRPGNPSTLNAGPDTSICEGEIIKLNGIFTGQANFFWHSANGSFDNPNSLNTNYYSNIIGDERIYFQAADDCKEWLDSLEVHILPRQIVQVTGDTILNPCKEITFIATGGTNYIWTPSSFIECLDPPCSRVLLKSTVATRFTISSSGPCVVPANLYLSLAKIQTDIYLPNVFSPNGDNINDVFLPVFNCEQLDYYDLQIFDRWGNLLFESQNKDKGWDGKYQDQKMNPGVYPYVVQYQVHGAERKVKAGDVTLVR